MTILSAAILVVVTTFVPSAFESTAPPANLADVTASSAILAVVTESFAGSFNVVAAPICITKTLDPAAGAVANLILPALSL